MPRRKLDRPNYRLRARDGIWYIDWTDESSGHSRSISTRQTERAKAEIWRDQWIAGRDQPIPPSQATIAEIMQAYTTARLPHVESKETMVLCGRTIANLIGNLQPAMLARSTYTIARGAGLSSGTVRREVTVLRAALSWAVREKWIDAAPYVEMPPRPPPRERWLTRDEVDRLVEACATPHIRLFVILAYHTAARAGAILDLTWDRIDFERRLISYGSPGRRITRKRRATVPLNAAALSAVQASRIVATSEYVIEYNGRKVASIKKAFARACKRAGIEDCSPHVLRHSAASHMVMAGVPIAQVARMLGDTEETTERVYGKWAPDYLRNAADALAGNISDRSAETTKLNSKRQANPP